MAMKQPPIEIKMGAPEWMVTFADLMSLLLTFFVLLLSFSSMEVSKFNTLSGAIRSAFGLRSPLDLSDRPSGSTFLPNKSPAEKTKTTPKKEKLMVVKLRSTLEQSGLTDAGNVKVTKDGVVLEMDGDVFFSSGKSEIKPEARAILDQLIEVAGNSGGEIRVEGHTDDVPIKTATFPSNWELSGARAGSAVRYLTEGGVAPSRVSALGRADTRPLVPNDSPENRGKNRRIEFVFITKKEAGFSVE